MPEWMDDSTYDFTHDLSKEGWAWEFLRRNPKYVDDYHHVRAIYAEGEKLYGPFHDNEEKWRQFEKVIVKEPFTINGDSMGKWNGRAWDKNVVPEWTYLEVYIAGTWGLKHRMAAPSSPEVPEFRYPYNHPKYMAAQDSNDYLIPPPSPDEKAPPASQYIAIGFDLSLPIDKQVEKAREILITQREHRKIKVHKNQIHKDTWRKYLRVLDALEQLKDITTNQRYSLITEHINLVGPNDPSFEDRVENVSELAHRAKSMMKKDYIKILRSI